MDGFRISRRQSLAGLSVAGLSGLLLPSAYAQKKRETTGVGIGPKGSAIEDEDIFTFALNLEYMEAEFYLRATTGKGISDADAGADAGRVVGGHEAQFKEKAIRASSSKRLRGMSWPTFGSTARRLAGALFHDRRSTSMRASRPPLRLRDCLPILILCR